MGGGGQSRFCVGSPSPEVSLVGLALVVLMLPSAVGASSHGLVGSQTQPGLRAATESVPSAATGATWTNVTPRNGPSGIGNPMMAYDAADGYVVLFGGLNSSGFSTQTWKYVGGTWTQLHPTNHPMGRVQGMMAYDPRDHYVVLYGGWGPGGVFDNDTWTFSGGRWTDITNTSGGMPYLAEGGMTYDPNLGRVVMFGGWTDPCSCVDWPSDATYGFVRGTWTQLFPNHHAKGTSSLAPQGAAIAYDARDGYIVKFGGWDQSTVGATTWNLSHGHWTQIKTSRSPSWRSDDVLVFDPKLGHLIMFGGQSDTTYGALNDTWKFVGGSWTQLHPAQAPPDGFAGSATYDAADGYILLYTGNYTWTFR